MCGVVERNPIGRIHDNDGARSIVVRLGFKGHRHIGDMHIEFNLKTQALRAY